ncbi:MAG: hypothetical protein CL763_06555 [Chloroflexi bacterium]|nr:hypothetical protein [Chloroflexota bacterium]
MYYNAVASSKILGVFSDADCFALNTLSFTRSIVDRRRIPMRRKVFLSFAGVLLLSMLTTVSVFADHGTATVLDGSAKFRDANAQSDSLVVDIQGLTVLSTGSKYQGWLVDEAGTKLNVGVFGVGPDLSGTYVSPTNSDLLADYKTFLVTIEPSPDPESADSGNVAYGDYIQSQVSDALPSLITTASQARAQANAIQTSANTAEAANTLVAQQSGAQAVMDAIGALKAKAENVSVQAADIKANAAGDAPLSDAADLVIASAASTIALADKLNANASRVLGATSAGIAVDLELDNLKATAAQLVSGVDNDGSGTIGNVGSENGAAGLYTSAQDIGAMQVVVGTPPATGDPMLMTFLWTALVLGIVMMVSGAFLFSRKPRLTIA